MAVAYMHLDEFEASRIHFERSIELLPEGAGTYYQVRFGDLYAEMGEIEAARELWSRGVSDVERKVLHDPDNPRMRALMALYYGALGDRENYEKEAAATLRLDPDGSTALNGLGYALLYLGDIQEGVALLRRALVAGDVWYPLAFDELDQLGPSPYLDEFKEEAARERVRMLAKY